MFVYTCPPKFEKKRVLLGCLQTGGCQISFISREASVRLKELPALHTSFFIFILFCNLLSRDQCLSQDTPHPRFLYALYVYISMSFFSFSLLFFFFFSQLSRLAFSRKSYSKSYGELKFRAFLKLSRLIYL